MLKSFTRKFPFTCYTALILFGTSFLLSCSKSDDQKKFEQEALRPPQNFTETNAGGEIIDNKKDSDDWRISPSYAGLVRVEIPAHPNPVVGERFEIDIFISGIDAIPSGRMDFSSIDDKGERHPVNYTVESVTTGFTTITLNRNQILGIFPNETSSLYRILISDGRNNIITYGDLQIGQSGTP